MTTEPTDVTSKLLAAAIEVFGETGFVSARVDEIARRAGVNKALLYYYFGSKDALYAAVISGVADQALAVLDRNLTPKLSPEDRVRAFANSIAEVARKNPSFPPLMLREIASGGAGLPDPVLARIAGVFGHMASILDDGARKKRFRRVDPVVTHMLFAGGLFVLLAASPIRKRLRNLFVPDSPASREPPPEELPGLVADLILNGVSRSTTHKRSRKKQGRVS